MNVEEKTASWISLNLGGG